MGNKSGFRDRISLSRLAWAKYREAVPEMPVQPPALFEAGFALGMVMSTTRRGENDSE